MQVGMRQRRGMLKRQATRDRGASACTFLLPPWISQTVVPNRTFSLFNWIYLRWGPHSGHFYPFSPSKHS